MSNPFDGKSAVENSCYCGYEEDTLRLLTEEKEAPRDVRFVHSKLRSHILDEDFSCVGAKAAINGNVYRFGLYSRMNSDTAIQGLCRDLYTFVEERQEMAGDFTTYIASFLYPLPHDETQFEAILWDALQRIHHRDSKYHDWDPAVCADPESPMFSFSVAETAFFVVGLHPGSSRLSRRFSFPTLVFNPHEQFETLREIGVFERLKDTIRENERELQGYINPNVTDYGDDSEARQYAGCPVDDGWTPPFVPLSENDNS